MPQILSRLNEVLDVCRAPGGLEAMFARRPRSIASFKIVSDLQQERTPFKTIIDGGANVGQFARAAVAAFPEAEIYSFEPLPDVAQQLSDNMRDCSRHHVFQVALGDRVSRVAFHRNQYTQASSILPPLDATNSLLGNKTVTSTVDVEVTTLDRALKNLEVLAPALMKLDLQGYELPALRGARETLERCSHVLLETVFRPSYENEPLFPEVQAFLRETGFEFSRPLNFVRDPSGAIVQMDALFVGRRNS